MRGGSSPGFDSSVLQIPLHSNEINDLAAILTELCNGVISIIYQGILFADVSVIVVACLSS